MVKQSGRLCVLFLFLCVAVSVGWAADPAPVPAASAGSPDDVLASVGDQTITRKDLDKELERFRANGNPQARAMVETKDGQKQFLQQLVEITLLKMEAKKQGILDRPELKDQVKDASVALLSQAYMSKLMEKAQVAKEDVEKYYNENKAQFSEPDRYHLFQMTFTTEADAKKAKADLDGGKSFLDMAKASSTDNFKSSGGDRGFVAGSELSPAIGAAIEGLKTDQVSEPIKEEDNKFLLVKQTEKQAGTVKPLDAVRTQIEKTVGEEGKRKIYEARMGELEKEFGFKINPEAFTILERSLGKGAEAETIAPAEMEKPLFTVGSDSVPLKALAPELERIPPFIRPALLSGDGLKDFIHQFCYRELLKRYVTAKMDELTKEFPEAVQDAQMRVGLKALIEENIAKKVTISDEEIKEHYTKNLAQFSRPEQVRAHHILVDAEDKAKSLQERIAKGEKFEDLAKAESKCPSGKEGGDLGFFGKGQMVPEFDDVAQKGEIGKVVGPVKTKFGFHLVRVDERKAAGTTPLEEVKDQIKSQLLPYRQKAAFEKFVQDLRKDFPVKEFPEKL